MDPTTGQVVQILHSNIHACKYSVASICDPFVDADKVRDHTPNQPGNFTLSTSDSTFIYPDLSFPEKGDIFVLAHLALPGPNTSFRYDFAVYQRITIVDTATTSSQTLAPPISSTGAANTVVLIVAIGGGVVVAIVIAVVVLLMYRRKHATINQSHVQSPYPVHSSAAYTPMEPESGRPRYKDTTHSSGGRPTVTGTADTFWQNETASQIPRTSASVVAPGGSTPGSGFSTGSASAAGITRADEELLQLWRLDENHVVAGHMLSRGMFGVVQ
ncbi:hypothetical protein, variant [Aphanomyces astaci]|nr:hypothetical protein, variant [Aphanomyces astaci]ETV69080.1 hypothetical protein, variant [Aphanomyces astaci]|eukprot:XP_009841539.1 hypothetical protein, variant [Aphanomyces astaci]